MLIFPIVAIFHAHKPYKIAKIPGAALNIIGDVVLVI
jgi:hypothetical protein